MGAAPGQGLLTASTYLAQTAALSFQSRSQAWPRRPPAIWATPAHVWQMANGNGSADWVWVTPIALAGDPSGRGSSPLLPLHPLLLGAGS